MKRSYSVLAPILFLLPGIAPASAEPAQEFHLNNGMKVIVKEDHRAPIAVTQVWYRVGSSYEPQGITGVSHVLEHMMFKGTEQLGPNEFSRIISENGGRENAFTSRDYTAYHQTLAADRLEVAFKLEADRMANLRLDPDEFAKEVEVVKEERRLRTEDKPRALAYEKFNAVAYRSLPYRQPVIGWMADLEQMTADDLRQWYERWYSPANATLVVVGDVQPQEIFKLAQKTFGAVPSRRVPAPKGAREPPQQGVTRLSVRLPAKQPYLMLGYKVPTLATTADSWEAYALEVLAAVLDGGSSARLDRNLVRGSRVAASADADYSAFKRLSGMLILDGTPNDGQEIEALEAALKAEIERLRSEPVEAAELKRVITQTVASKVYEQDSVFYQGMQMGVLETVGLDWRLADTYVDELRRVTPEQVLAVARKYLVDDNLTVAELEPLPMNGGGTPRTTEGDSDA
ncbi:MAG: pitrilysin family protein [Pseudomonadota bacterium]